MPEYKKYLNTHMPVTFQKINYFDDRFVSVKIFLMHLGENYNGSYFTREAVEKALPSLKNTPILGYVKENAIGQKDYAGHEMELVVDEGEYKFKYLGSAFGVIPESHNARWEKRAGDDGVERDYLVVDALMWSKFDDALDIMDRDEIKGQSMELHTDYSGHFNEDGLFQFDTFSFYGACMLGDGVDPAMQRATIERQFSADSLQTEVNTMMEEFKIKFSKGVNNMTLEELLAQYEVSKEQLSEAGINAEDYSIEDLEAKIQEFQKEENFESGGEGESGESGESEASQAGEEAQGEGEEDSEGEDSSEGEDGAEGDTATPEGNEGEGSENPEGDENPEEDEEINEEFEALKKEHEELQDKYNKVVVELENFKKNEHEAKANSIISNESFAELEESDVKDIKDNIHGYSLEDIEDKLFARLGRKKAQFSKTNEEPTRFSIYNSDNGNTGSSYDHYFQKHIGNK